MYHVSSWQCIVWLCGFVLRLILIALVQSDAICVYYTMLLCLLLSCCGKFIEFGRLVDMYVHVMCTHALILSSTKVTVCLYTVILSAFFTLYMFAVLCIIIIIIIAIGSSTLVCPFCHNKLTVLHTHLRVKGTSSPMCSTVQYFVNLSQLKGKDTHINKTLLDQSLLVPTDYMHGIRVGNRALCPVKFSVLLLYMCTTCTCMPYLHVPFLLLVLITVKCK